MTLLQIFAHATKAQLLWHVQKFVAISLSFIELQIKLPAQSNYDGKSLVKWALVLALLGSEFTTTGARLDPCGTGYHGC